MKGYTINNPTLLWVAFGLWTEFCPIQCYVFHLLLISFINAK